MFVRPSEGRVTSPFGMRTHPVTHKPTTMHWGVDFGKDVGTRIVAAADGKVTRARNAETDGYGKLVMIEHVISGRVYTTVYAHLASFNVREGQHVKAGDTIAVMGTTGVSTGVHLHFEIHAGAWNNRFTNAVDPMLYIVDPATKALQVLLVAAGYGVTIDGIAGPATIQAVKAFQQALGIAVDGVAGIVTIAALEHVRQAEEDEYKAQTDAKEAVYLELNSRQRDELATVFEFARSKGVFSSAQHAADVKAGKMTRDTAIYLNTLIAAAALNGGERVK